MHLEGCTSSGLKSSSAAIAARPCLVHAITIIPAAAASSATVYDNATTNSGTVVAYAGGVANGESVTFMLSHPIECTKGAYVAVSGSGANYILHYSLL